MRQKTGGGRSGIHAVAQAAGVSVMTVSRAMRGVEGVSESRRKEIVEIARRMNYVPNSNARALSLTSSNLIGVSLPTLFNDVFADILAGMRDTISNAGYSSVIDTTEYDSAKELAWVERLLSWRPAAVILTGTTHDKVVRQRLRHAGVPTLETWEYSADPIDLCVGIDHFMAGIDIGGHLAQLGYRKPVFIGTAKYTDPRADARADGIAKAFAAHGVARLARIATPGGNAFSMGAAGFHAARAQGSPDVMVFLNDHLAFGGLMAAGEVGLDVPNDIGIVGFNDLALNAVLPIPLTTVRTPRHLMGVMGARHLLARLHGVMPERAVALPVEVIAGATTRPQSTL